MTFFRTLPILLAAGVIGAHFLRVGAHGPMLTAWLAPSLLLIQRRWAARVLQSLLVLGAGFWLVLLAQLAGLRQEMGMGWVRLAVILVLLALGTVASALALEGRPLRTRYREVGLPASASVAAFWLTAALLVVVQVKVATPALLAERFWRGAGWLTIGGLAVYAAWITEKLLDPTLQPRWRGRIWGLFSAVFFLQLTLGLAGVEKLLMTGALHLPVPAVIVAGPLYRGGGFFMVILFGATLLLVGPAWCSHLCYIGAWDHALAGKGAPRARPGRWQPWLRWGLLGAVVMGALGLRAAGASAVLAAVAAAAFGLVGVALMLLWSRRTGTLVHCTWYCPVGALACGLGRVSPHRIRLSDSCTACGSCQKVCRYDALSEADIARHRPGPSCTLCGDCVGACKHDAIGYRFPGLSANGSRALFLTLVVSLHAVFLGVARL